MQQFLNEKSINILGCQLLEKRKVELTIKILELIKIEYPKSWNIYNSLVDAYYGNKI